MKIYYSSIAETKKRLAFIFIIFFSMLKFFREKIRIVSFEKRAFTRHFFFPLDVCIGVRHICRTPMLERNWIIINDEASTRLSRMRSTFKDNVGRLKQL